MGQLKAATCRHGYLLKVKICGHAKEEGVWFRTKEGVAQNSTLFLWILGISRVSNNTHFQIKTMI